MDQPVVPISEHGRYVMSFKQFNASVDIPVPIGDVPSARRCQLHPFRRSTLSPTLAAGLDNARRRRRQQFRFRFFDRSSSSSTVKGKPREVKILAATTFLKA